MQNIILIIKRYNRYTLFCRHFDSVDDRMLHMRSCKRGGTLLQKDSLSFIKIDNSTILNLSKDKVGRRGLLIYSYLSNLGAGARGIQTDVSKLVEIMGVKISTGSKTSIGEALNKLVDLNLIYIYKDRALIDVPDIAELVKKPNRTFWVKIRTSVSEINYTLVPSDVIDRIIHSIQGEKPDDLFVVASYICLKTERREGVSPVMWSGIRRICRDIHMTDRKLVKVLGSLLELKVVYFKKIELSGDRSNYIYGLYQDKEDVDTAAVIARKNNRLDKRVKLKTILDNVIEIIDDEFLIDIKLSSFFERHGIECNSGVADESNKFCQKHGHAKLMEILGEHNSEIYNADNKIGAYRSILRRNF